METINNNPVEVKKMAWVIADDVKKQFVNVSLLRRLIRRNYLHQCRLAAYAGAVAMWMYVRKTYTIKKKVCHDKA